MAGEEVATEAIRRMHRRGGSVEKAAGRSVRVIDRERLVFEGPPGSVADAVDAELAWRRQEGAARKAEPVDMHRTWTGGGSDELRKRAPEPPVAGVDAEVVALVKPEHAAGGTLEATGERRQDLMRKRATAGSRGSAGAIRDAEREHGRLVALGKANTGWRDDARLVAAERLAAALAKPAPRAPLSAPEPTLAPWRPHAVDEAAVEGAAATMGGSIDDLEAAIRDGSVSWETRYGLPPAFGLASAVANRKTLDEDSDEATTKTAGPGADRVGDHDHRARAAPPLKYL